MRRISISIFLALTILGSLSIVTAQQTLSNASTDSVRSSPTPPPGPIIGGMGTTNYIPIWASSSFLLNSVIYQASGGNVGVGTNTPQATLDVHGSISAESSYEINGTVVLSTPLDNLFIGPQAGANGGSGGANTYVGFYAGEDTTSGNDNTFMGADSGEDNSSGYANTFYGIWSGINNSTGSLNTFLGAGAGGYNSTGNGNIMVGSYAGGNNTNGSNNLYLASFGAAESNVLRIGLPYSTESSVCSPLPAPCGQSAAYVAGVYGVVSASGIPVYVNSNGQLGTLTSSRRFKEQVRDMGDSTDALMKLRPVTFLYKPEYANSERTLQYGLIAEEVAKVYPELVAYDNDGQPYSVRYQYLSTMLLNEVQKQYHRAEAEAKVITDQQSEIQALQEQNRDFQERLSRLEKLIPQTVAQK